MLTIQLPDGAVRSYPIGVTPFEIARNIGAGLARAALAAHVNGRLVDLSTPLHEDAVVAIVTGQESAGLEVIRHSTAHLLAHAVKQLYPDAQVTIGPVIEHGFYYDFAYTRAFTPEDLEAIEVRMRELVRQDLPVSWKTVSREQAVTYFTGIGEHYKSEIVASIPVAEEVRLYSEGEFTDLCRGPHVPSTGRLKAFKLTKLAGAYWRGDPKNAMLQRIYGTAWPTQEALDQHLHRLEEAEKRDHRRIGKLLDLFHMQEEAPGMVFWHPKGWSLWQRVEQYLRVRLSANGYKEIRTPQIIDRGLWERSGHWENYREHMFTTESEKRDYALKPMNCPGHVQVFNHGLHSYRDLPLRLAEFGACHRNEPSGALHGLMRVRGFVQDDAHIFCTEEQIIGESRAFNELAMGIYRDFGFEQVAIKIALRPDKRIGSDALWDRAEQGLRDALGACGLAWEELPGEGAFYGPKVEYHINDAIGRSWQCGTLQLDFMLPARFNAEYVAQDNTRQCPVMLHRAVVGSMERFLGILIEHYSGRFPLWLAPMQLAVLTITDRNAAYAEKVVEFLTAQGFSATADLRNEKITYKIREHSVQRLPYLAIVGDKEMEAGLVALRNRAGEDLGPIALDALAARLHAEVACKHAG